MVSMAVPVPRLMALATAVEPMLRVVDGLKRFIVAAPVISPPFTARSLAVVIRPAVDTVNSVPFVPPLMPPRTSSFAPGTVVPMPTSSVIVANRTSVPSSNHPLLLLTSVHTLVQSLSKPKLFEALNHKPLVGVAVL